MSDKISKIDLSKLSVQDSSLRKTIVLPLPPVKISMPSVEPPKSPGALGGPKSPSRPKKGQGF